MFFGGSGFFSVSIFLMKMDATGVTRFIFSHPCNQENYTQ